ncbi:MAG: BamA/TamA family outer membrane protein [Reichenbachiella sp.]
MKLKLLPLLLILFLSSLTFAQGIPGGGGGSGSKLDSTKNFNFMAVPYLNYSRSLGASFGAVPMAMYKVNKNDTISPASMSGMVGMYTTNKTWFAMFFQKLYLKEDAWRVTAAGGLASVNFQFYLEPINGFVGYNTNASFLYFDVQRKVIEDLYVGVHYSLTSANTMLDSIPDINTDTKLQGTGILSALDKRNDVYYPTNGSLSNIKWSSFPDFLNNENVSNKIEIDHNQFIAMADNDVLALRAKGGFGLGELAFEQQFIVGQADIRGYSEGKFRGDNMAAIQGEYRMNFENKFGLVGFFGLATIWGAINEEDNGKILPGGGAGFRYNIFPKYHMNVGMDAAIGKDDWGIYFKIGEAF